MIKIIKDSESKSNNKNYTSIITNIVTHTKLIMELARIIYDYLPRQGRTVILEIGVLNRSIYIGDLSCISSTFKISEKMTKLQLPKKYDVNEHHKLHTIEWESEKALLMVSTDGYRNSNCRFNVEFNIYLPYPTISDEYHSQSNKYNGGKFSDYDEDSISDYNEGRFNEYNYEFDDYSVDDLDDYNSSNKDCDKTRWIVLPRIKNMHSGYHTQVVGSIIYLYFELGSVYALDISTYNIKSMKWDCCNIGGRWDCPSLCRPMVYKEFIYGFSTNQYPHYDKRMLVEFKVPSMRSLKSSNFFNHRENSSEHGSKIIPYPNWGNYIKSRQSMLYCDPHRGRLYIIDDVCSYYDIEKRIWHKIPSMPEPLSVRESIWASTCVTVDLCLDRLIVIPNDYSSRCQWLNLDTHSWSIAPIELGVSNHVYHLLFL